MKEKILDKFKYKNLALFGDNIGLPMMLKIIPSSIIKCAVAASIRPQYITNLRDLATKKRIPLFTQPKWNSKNYHLFYKKFKNCNIDLIVCNSYSMKVRKDILNLVNYNAVNIHCSLLPKNRGPNPVQWSIINGEKETGVTLHYMDDGFDSGDIIAQKKIRINNRDTWISLQKKLIIFQKEILKRYIPLILNGLNKRVAQRDDLATMNRRLNSLSPKIDFNTMSNDQIYDLIRAQVKPLRGAYLQINKKVKHFDQYITIDEIERFRRLYKNTM